MPFPEICFGNFRILLHITKSDLYFPQNFSICYKTFGGNTFKNIHGFFKALLQKITREIKIKKKNFHIFLQICFHDTSRIPSTFSFKNPSNIFFRNCLNHVSRDYPRNSNRVFRQCIQEHSAKFFRKSLHEFPIESVQECHQKFLQISIMNISTISIDSCMNPSGNLSNIFFRNPSRKFVNELSGNFPEAISKNPQSLQKYLQRLLLDSSWSAYSNLRSNFSWI